MTAEQIISRPKTKRHGHPQTNPNSLANLIPYKPGENGHGRVYPLKERLYHALDKPLKEPKPDAPAGEQLVYATLKNAIECLPAPFHEVWDRVEGKLTEKLSAGFQDNRVINFVLSSEQGKQLIEGISKRLTERKD